MESERRGDKQHIKSKVSGRSGVFPSLNGCLSGAVASLNAAEGIRMPKLRCTGSDSQRGTEEH